MNITCSVYEYYPSIDIHFRFKSKNIETIQTEEWNNTDGTQNRSITITADVSDEPYVCAATNIPGYDQEERVSTIYLTTPPKTTTEDTVVKSSTNSNASRKDDKLSKYRSS